MTVKQRISVILRAMRSDMFEARWPNEQPIEINAYKLQKLTGLASGTCLKIFSNPRYVPDVKVMNALCDFFDLQPGDFLYYERESDSVPRGQRAKDKQTA